jgi:hypothetical protein
MRRPNKPARQLGRPRGDEVKDDRSKPFDMVGLAAAMERCGRPAFKVRESLRYHNLGQPYYDAVLADGETLSVPPGYDYED